jgi:lipoate-protein ligase A
MAADSALLGWVRDTGCGMVRVYGWDRPTVSFGRHEATAGRFSPASLAAAGVAAVRRPTGGRALLHHREVTYAVALPLAAAQGWRPTYAALNARLVAALRAVGVPAALAPDAGQTGTRDGTPASLCFEAPAMGEVMVAGRKLVGSAVWREGDAYLQHGSILWHDDQALLARAAAVPLPPPPPAATLAEHAAGVSPEAVADALVAALTAPAAGGGGVDVHPFAPTPAFRAEEARLRDALGAAAWLWRR